MDELEKLLVTMPGIGPLIGQMLQLDDKTSDDNWKWCDAHKDYEPWNTYVSHCNHCGGANH